MASFPQQFGSYTLHELIARGGMAEVYRATMPGVGGFEKTVAIKKILPHLSENDEFITMLVDEARIIVGLNHANIAQVYDLGCIDDTYYIAMEYVHSVDLSEILKELKKANQTVPLQHAVYIASCICAGLHVAHSKSDEHGRPQHIVHRDVSPHNVLISFGGDVKIIDFGVAKARGKETHTKAGVIKGKLLYMAPEQAMAKEIDGRSDLFAVGIILYNMLTNQLPFDGENEFQIYNNILSRDIPPPKAFNPQIPEELNQIVMMMLQRDPDKRYQDGYSCKLDLDRVLHQISPGYSISRLSTWVEDSFSYILQARRQKRENMSGHNPMPNTPSSPANKTPSSRFPTAQPPPMVPSPSPSGSWAPTPNPTPSPSASGGFGAVQQFGSPSASGSFGSVPGPSSSGAFSQMPPGPNASGMFNAAPPPPQQTQVSADQTGPIAAAEKKSLPLVPLIGSLVLLLVLAALVAVNLTMKEEEAPTPEIIQPVRNVDEPAVVEEPEVEEAPVPPEKVPAEPELDLVKVKIDSVPPGANVVVAGEEKGTTPVEVELERSGEALFVEVHLEGYESDAFRLVPAEDSERTIELEAVAPVVEEKPEPKKQATPKPPKKTKKVEKEEDPFSIPLLDDAPKKTKKTDPKPAEKKEEKKDDDLMNPFL